MSSKQLRRVERALLSVSDKTGLVPFARGLSALGVALLSTGGTYRALQDAGIEVTEVSAYTGFPEMMDGRVKSLHPKIHGGILGRREQDEAVMQSQGIPPIDLVAVNLYPFQETVARPDCHFEEAVEKIDIGGPAMVRSAAKNHADVLVVVQPEDYACVLSQLEQNAGCSDLSTRYTCAVKAFRHTVAYDAAVAAYLGSHAPEGVPDSPSAAPQGCARVAEMPGQLVLEYEKIQDLRYGENPHQRAAFYRDPSLPQSAVLTAARQHQGKALSFNNIADTDAALECVRVFDTPACVIVKHANPCGVGVAADLDSAYHKAYATDPTSAFGGIIAFNRCLEGELLERILTQQFVEVVIAPEFSSQALEVAQQKKNLRVLSCGELRPVTRGLELKRVSGGLLVQQPDDVALLTDEVQCVSAREPTSEERADLLFAWQVAWFVKSNAIVYAREGQTIGIGAGQMSRVISARIAAMKAEQEGLEVMGAVMASDAFFPFRDGIDTAARAGIRAVIQPGGSMRDAEVVAAANEHDMAMLFTGLRHFRH